MQLNINAALYVFLTSNAASEFIRILKNAIKYECRPIRLFNVKGAFRFH